MFLFNKIVLGITVRFQDSADIDIPDVTKHEQFKIVLSSEENIEFICRNTLFNLKNKSNYKFYENNCKFYITEIRKRDNEGRKVYTTNKNDNNLGYYNVCDRTLQYKIDGKIFRYSIEHNEYVLNTYKNEGELEHSDFEEERDIFGMPEIYNSNENTSEYTKYVTFNIFVIINYLSNITNIKALFKNVNEIFNNENIKINVVGQLTVQNKSIENLTKLQSIMNEIKTRKENTQIKEADLIMMVDEINNENSNDANNESIHGMTFTGGAGTFDTNYSVVKLHRMTSSDNFKINVRKVAHEIAHSMGVPHDTQLLDVHKNKNNLKLSTSNFIMSKKDSKNNSQSENYLKFSDTSDFYIKKYYRRNLNSKNSTNFDQNTFVMTSADAIKLVNSLRNKSYAQIVHQKLHGKEPDTLKTRYYLIISLLFYVCSVTAAVYYIK